MPTNRETTVVRIELGRLDYVQRLSAVLADLEGAYNALYYFFDLSHDLERAVKSGREYRHNLPLPVPFPPLFSPPVNIGGEKDLPLFVLPTDRLALRACQIGSPGWLEVIGNMNPLEVWRKYAQDRHERRKDREYREQAEEEKLHLENQLLKNEVLRRHIDLMENLGIPRSTISEIVNGLLVAPMNALEQHMDNGNIRDITAAPEQHVQRPSQE